MLVSILKRHGIPHTWLDTQLVAVLTTHSLTCLSTYRCSSEHPSSDSHGPPHGQEDYPDTKEAGDKHHGNTHTHTHTMNFSESLLE